jgi:site-specific DNA recombinase
MAKNSVPPSLRGVIYCRTSTTAQEASIGEQTEWATTAAGKEKVRVVRTFQDEGIPGDELARRPGLIALLEFVEGEQQAGRPVDCIVCWDLDRLSRSDSFKMAVLLERLIEAGCTRALSKEGWHDWEDDTDRILNSLKQDFSRRGYSRSISGNVSRSAAKRAKLGQWCGGRYPYGYRLGDDKHLAADKEKAKWVTWMYQTYLAQDTSLEEVAKELTHRKAPPPNYAGKKGVVSTKVKSGEWTALNVGSILTNPIYTGTMYYGRTHQGKYHKIAAGEVRPTKKQTTASGRIKVQKVPLDDQTVVPNAHPALIDEATYRAVRDKLQKNKPGFVPGSTRRTFTWIFGNGMLRCGNCGSVMWGVVTNKKRTGKPEWESRVYACANYMRRGGRRSKCGMNAIKESTLLKIVAKRISEYFSNPELVAQVQAEMTRQHRNRTMDTEGRAQQMRKRLAALEVLIATSSRRLVSVPDDLVPTVVEELRALKAEKESIRAEMKQDDAAQHTFKLAEELVGKGLKRLQTLPQIINMSKPKLALQTFRSIVEKIVLDFEHREENGRRRCEFKGLTIYPTEAMKLLGMEEMRLHSNEDIRLPISLKYTHWSGP